MEPNLYTDQYTEACEYIRSSLMKVCRILTDPLATQFHTPICADREV